MSLKISIAPQRAAPHQLDVVARKPVYAENEVPGVGVERNQIREGDVPCACAADASVGFDTASFSPDGALYLAGYFGGTATLLSETFIADNGDAFVMKLNVP